MVSHRVEFPCGEIMLEGMIRYPEAEGPSPIVVLCHPHPLYGGSMFNNVVEAVARKIEGKGIACLRFNFRGVGRSGGSFGDGIGEQEDLKAALSFAAVQEKIDAKRMGACGYSFGSTVALAVAAADSRVAGVAGISPFIEPPQLLDRYPRPKLFVCGGEDEWIDTRKLQAQVETLPDPKELVVYPGVDHFWAGTEEAMAEKVAQFFQGLFETPKIKNQKPK